MANLQGEVDPKVNSQDEKDPEANRQREAEDEEDMVWVQPPYPTVNWEDLSRPNFKDRVGLPSPEYLPILGCSSDPQFYLPTPTTDCLGRNVRSPPAFEGKSPFGSTRGYRTNLGRVAMPSGLVNGYLWDMEEGRWTIAADPPGRSPRRLWRRRGKPRR